MAALGAPFQVAAGQKPDFWKRFQAGQWEPATLAALDRFVRPGSRFIDIGAWIGPTALHAAARGAEVVAFEPDPAAARDLAANLALNAALAGRVTLIEAALWTEAGSLPLHSRTLGDSESSIFAEIERKGGRRSLERRAEVAALDAREAFERYRFGEAALIKMDVEGAEYALLPHLADSLAQRRPPLLLSLHPGHLGADLADEAARLLRRQEATRLVLASLETYRAHRRKGSAFVPVEAGELRRDHAVMDGTWLFLPASLDP